MSDDDARRRIRADVDETFFVEAGAGAGKTSTLVERIVGLVARGVPLTRIAAITFTEAAAAELRDRVRGRLASALANVHDAHDASDSQAADRFAEALDVLDEAPIQTLHAFAARILTSYAVDAGLPPAFDVRDSVASSIQFDRDWTRFVDRWLSSQDRLPTVGVALTLELKPDALREMAAAFNDRWDQLRETPFRDVR
jgi:ATP-dependent exoDNAse (exonuclease V) beta subunit